MFNTRQYKLGQFLHKKTIEKSANAVTYIVYESTKIKSTHFLVSEELTVASQVLDLLDQNRHLSACEAHTACKIQPLYLHKIKNYTGEHFC
jgi:hypothetical protein